MPIAEDEIATLLMEIVVMLAPWRAAPLGGAGGGPGVPLGVRIAGVWVGGLFGLEAGQVHVNVMFLDEDRSAGAMHLLNTLVQNQLAQDQIVATESGWGVLQRF